MRRRRKKNNLLTRIILISIGVHAIALPIAAHYGALDKLKKDFGVAQVMVVNVPPVEEKKEAVKKDKKPPKKSESTVKKGSNTAHHSSRANSKPNPFQPKVEASTTPDDGTGEGPSVDANGTGKAGVLPSSGAPVAKAPVADTSASKTPTVAAP